MSALPPANELRPSPEALLSAARPAGRGRLKIFLGAAPGVGKTFEMLMAGRARLLDGVDVVVGLVETHGRAETAALLAGLEMVPRRRSEYRGREVEEMDLDALLTRRPRLALVDELAHTNAEGCRHPKRYLDVEELLAAGIDVYTTLNIQHVESLNDVVASITRIRVRETVPDAVLDAADDIEVVDLAPADLIQRLSQGKIYLPKHAERALRHYFSPGNLTALRELALRRTAQRVDEQLLTHMQAHAIAGPWAAGERVLVCISDDPRGPGLVRAARRISDRLRAPLIALHVETLRTGRLDDAARDRIAEALRLAERLGAQAMTIPGGTRVADDLIGFAQANNVTQIILGKSDRSRWFELLHGSVVRDLLRRAGAISVQVIAGDPAERGPAAPAIGVAARRSEGGPLPFVLATLAVTVSLAIAAATHRFVGQESVDLIFLGAVIAVSANFGLAPALYASVLASLAYNFFFIPPLYTFTIAAPTNIVALFVFLVVALVVSNLAARFRAQVVAARQRARTTEALYAFSRKIAGTITADDLLWAAAFQLASMLKAEVVILLPEQGLLQVRVGYPPEDRLDEADIAAAKWAYETNQPAGHSSATLPGTRRLFLPLHTGRGAVGVVGLARAGGFRPAPDERRLLDALLDQIAVAIERVALATEMDRARVESETERLRSALLTSLSHDLKTPLAGIIGAVTALRSYGDSFDTAARDELTHTIEAEAERLDRFVANLLDMTRIESGPIALNREPVDIAEVVATALARTRRQLADHRVATRLAPDLQMLRLDTVLLEQVLVNLLDNAAKYAPAGSEVTVVAARSAEEVRIEILDEGPGIPPADLDRVFDKFVRSGRRDGRPPGTGLGLAICKGFVEALGGTIAAANRTDRQGAAFAVSFPAALVVPTPEAEEAA